MLICDTYATHWIHWLTYVTCISNTIRPITEFAEMKKKFSLPLRSSVCWRLDEHQSFYFVHKWTEQNECPFDNIFMTQWFRFLIDHLSVILFTFISNLNAYTRKISCIWKRLSNIIRLDFALVYPKTSLEYRFWKHKTRFRCSRKKHWFCLCIWSLTAPELFHKNLFDTYTTYYVGTIKAS